MGNSKNDEICAKVVGIIQEQLAKGEVPWHKPWTSASPVNGVSKKMYRSTNYFVLSLIASAEGYTDNRWLTFKQAKDLSEGVEHSGVKRGARGTPVIFWKFPERSKDANEETDQPTYRPAWARLSYCWNVEQCNGVLRSEGGKLADYEKPKRDNEPLAAAQAIHDAYQTRSGVAVKHGTAGAYYTPSTDEICLPHLASFDSAAEYHGVRFHEEVHSTGATKRLNRDLSGVLASQGGEPYGFEELVAELGSAMLRAQCGIEVNHVNSAAYCSAWSRVLSDPTMFTKAAAKAQKAVDYLLNCGLGNLGDGETE
ncbi:MAG TPA: zincin-like metallopeptidase domain-containing protein [Capsulimonadaceae bacterium]|jgi:antirestriction protein ArdC